MQIATKHVYIPELVVDRCGMVYLDPGDLKWKPYVQTWLDSRFPVKLSDATKVLILFYTPTYITMLFQQQHIRELFSDYVDDGLKFIRKQAVQGMQMAS